VLPVPRPPAELGKRVVNACAGATASG